MVIDWLSGTILLPELHAALGAAIVFGAYLLARDLPPHRADGRSRYAWNRVAILAFFIIDFFKELLWDPVHETDNPFIWQGLIDFGWYLFGAAVALGLIYARFRKL